MNREKSRELLETLGTYSDYNVAGNGKRECLKTDGYKTISSQAACKQVEGSTTRSWSLSLKDMAVKIHECGTLLFNSDDIVCSYGRS